MKRSELSTVIYEEILNEDRAWLVPAPITAPATKVSQNVFDLLSDQGSGATEASFRAS